MTVRLSVPIASLAIATLVGCASGRADIVNGPGTEPGTPELARFDRGSLTCSTGSKQLLDPEKYLALIDGWVAPGDCEGPEKIALPGYADYPREYQRPGQSGSAHVLVRLEPEGQVESVTPVCATDEAYAQAAMRTTSRIQFSPMLCAGVPTRIAFMLPLDYDYP